MLRIVATNLEKGSATERKRERLRIIIIIIPRKSFRGEEEGSSRSVDFFFLLREIARWDTTETRTRAPIVRS